MYKTQLKSLNNMGFLNNTLNIEALIVSEGDLEKTVAYIFNNN